MPVQTSEVFGELHSRIQRCQMFMVGCDQIPLDVGVQGRLFVWIFLRLFENKFDAGLAQEVPDQHAALAIDERIDRQRILAFEFYRADGPRQTSWTKVAVVEPERFDGIAELRFRLREQCVE